MTATQTLVIPSRADQPERQLTLARPHTPASSPLRAWSAADELVLAELAGAELDRMLIVNDEFGALSCGFADRQPVVWVDSALSRAAIQANLAVNDLLVAGDRIVAGSEIPVGPFDVVVIRIPKSTALLAWQLGHIAQLVEPGTRVIGVAMARHISRSTRQAFEHAIGPTDVSLATRKARLIHSVRNTEPAPAFAPSSQFTLDDGTIVVERPGVFSAGHLDTGTALLLEHTWIAPGAHVLDLGAGYGVVAASLARSTPDCTFMLLDVSDLAIEAARETWSVNGLDKMRGEMVVADGLQEVPAQSFDLVVSNPPFHQGHAVDEHLAERLLAGAARVLRADGRLLAVGQRDLHLHTRLRRWFANVRVLSKHPVFVVVEASGPK